MSYIADPAAQEGCSLGSAVSASYDAPSVHLPFAEFSGLLTHKLLCQLEMLEADTVVEAASQNVTCFFWPGTKQGQVVTQEPKYQLQEFR